MATVNCEGKTIREINQQVKAFIAQGENDITITNTKARHNFGVALLGDIRLRYEGSVGYYCAGLIAGPTIDITGSAGWGVAESMMNGTVIVHGNAGNAAGASIRGGTLVIHGDAAARAGVSMKRGTIIIGGDCGYMSGFMAQKGRIIVCGNAGHAFGDSMYETICYVGGKTDDLGNDAVIEEMTDEDIAFLTENLQRHMPEKVAHIGNFKKVVSGRNLWNFKKSDRSVLQR